MSGSSIMSRVEGGRAVLQVKGSFDREAAWALRDRLAREPADELLIDFQLANDFSDLGIAVLAYALQRSPRRVLFCGLRQHQVRIFRYCGVTVEEVNGGEPGWPQPNAPAEATL